MGGAGEGEAGVRSDDVRGLRRGDSPPNAASLSLGFILLPGAHRMPSAVWGEAGEATAFFPAPLFPEMVLAQNSRAAKAGVRGLQLPTVHGALVLAAAPAPSVPRIPFPSRNAASPNLLLEV